MQETTSLTGSNVAQKATRVKQASKNKKPKKSKRVAVARNLYLKITPKGKKRWVLITYHKKKKHVRVIGDAAVMPQAEAEAIAAEAARDLRLGGSKQTFMPSARVFSAAGATLIKAYSRHWKSATHADSVYAFNHYLIPWFGDMPIEDITRQDVLNWFDSMHLKPGAANRTLPVLSTIMQQAEIYGFRPEGSNPCVNMKRYRLKTQECFLTPQQIQQLGQVLTAYEKRHRHKVALIRLLILTGCRKGELMNLQWSFYRDGHLHLPDSKTGPKMIYLSTPARQILDNLPRGRGKWVFPGPKQSKCLSEISLWHRHIRKQAGLDHVRLHDLRHSYASTAIQHGVDIKTLGMLLGHKDDGTTLKYVHLCDDAVLASVQLVGDVLDSKEADYV